MEYDDKNKINIEIKDKNGRLENFLVDFTMTIKKLKDEIHNTINCEPDEIDLYFGKTLLKDDCTLESYNIKNSNCVIEMKDKEILVKILGKIKIDEFEFDLILNINDTLNEMKIRINQLKGYPLNKFDLLNSEYNKIENNKTLKELNIKNNDKLRITFREENFDRFKYEGVEKKMIYIKFNIENKENKNEIPLITDTKIYIKKLKENIKKELKDKLDINCNSFELHMDKFILNNDQILFDIPNINSYNPIKLNLVENAENDILYIKKFDEQNSSIFRNIKLENYVSSLKQKIELEKRIFFDRIELWYNNQILDNNRTLKDYNINYSDTLQFKVLDIYNLKMRDKNISIFCSNDSNIFEFKSKIEEKTGIPLYQQKIQSFIDNSSYERYISEQNNDVIELKKKLYFVIINNEENSFLIDLYDNQTYDDLKKKIFKNLMKIENFDNINEKIFFDNLLILDNNNKEINDDDFIFFQNKKIPINLKITYKIKLEIKYHSKTLNENIRAYTSIKDLKNNLANELNIPFNEIILKINNENYILDNNKTFYDIIKQNFVFKYTLILERFKTLIINNDHKSELLEIEINKNINYLKERIKAQFNIRTDFCIFLNNQQLNDGNKLLNDYPEINECNISLLYLKI